MQRSNIAQGATMASAAAAAAAPSPSLKEIRQELKEWEHTFRRLHGRTPSKDDIKDSPSIYALYRQYARLKVEVERPASQSAENCKPSVDAKNKRPHNDYSNLASVRATSPATESSDSSQGSHISATPPKKKMFRNEFLSTQVKPTSGNPQGRTSDTCRPILGDISNKSTEPKILRTKGVFSGASKQSPENLMGYNRLSRAEERINSNKKLSQKTSMLGFTVSMQRYGECNNENSELEHVPAGFCLNRIASSHTSKSLSHWAFARAPPLFGADTVATANTTSSAAEPKPSEQHFENKARPPLDSEGNNTILSRHHDSDKLKLRRGSALVNHQTHSFPQSKSLAVATGLCPNDACLNQAPSELLEGVGKAEKSCDGSENLPPGAAVSQACLARMTVATLRELLALNGLPVDGKKSTLIARVLLEAKSSAHLKLPSTTELKTSRREIHNECEEAGTIDIFHFDSGGALPDVDTSQRNPKKKSRKLEASHSNKKSRKLETPQVIHSTIAAPKHSKSTVDFINWHSVSKAERKVGARENFVKLNLGRKGGRSHRFINATSTRKPGAGKYRFKRYGKRKAKKAPGSLEEHAADCAEEVDVELLEQESEVLRQNAKGTEESRQSCEKDNSLASAAAEALQTPTEHNLQIVLHLLLGFKSFRPGQLEAIQNILAGNSTMLVLPTGAGKSLAYQLPSFLLPGLTLVVSPLVSVMVDQAQHLPPSLPGAVLSSMQAPKEYRSILDMLQSGSLKVLFISPERLLCEKFIRVLQGLSCISLAVVDEAHCLSEWSHNFRSSYHRLGVILRQKLNIRCVLALTATATKRTMNSIMQTLSIAPANLMQLSIIRKNLICSASLSNNRCKDLLSLLFSSPYKDARSIIIYCNFQLEADNVGLVLRDNGIDAKSYHGGMNPVDRKHVQMLFCTNKIRVMVATVAFGLGLDKSDVSAVIHYGIPNSVEHYVQETGRAGRNGDTAHCHLLLDNMNFLKLRSLAFSDNVDVSAIQGLLSMIFCGNLSKDLSCQIRSISVESATKDLDLKEEIMTTALSYLEIGDLQFVSVLPTIKTTCTLQFHKNSPNLMARNSLLIDAILKRSREKNGEFTIELPSVANYMGLKLPDLQQQLQDLQSAGEISFNLKNPSLCFHVLKVPEDLSSLASKLLERFTQMETLKVKKLDFLFHTASGLTIKERTPTELQSCLQERIQSYFEWEGDDGIDCQPPTIVKHSSPFLKADIKVFLQNNSTSSFTSRAIARILHGIPSAAYPFNIWSQNHFWGRYKDTDFNAIKEAASHILKA